MEDSEDISGFDLVRIQDKIMDIQLRMIKDFNAANCEFVQEMLKRSDGKGIVEALDKKFTSQGMKPMTELCRKLDQL